MPRMWLWVEGKGEAPHRETGSGGAAAVLVRRILGEKYQDYTWQIDHLKVGNVHHFRAHMARYVNYLRKRRNEIDAVLVLLDLDDGCAMQIARDMANEMWRLEPPNPIAIVLAVREYEAWFLAAANSLWGRPYHGSPEGVRDAKGAVRCFLEDYAPTTYQASLSAQMDLTEAEQNSRSFRRIVHAVGELREAVFQEHEMKKVVVTPRNDREQGGVYG
nr:DUF4276 family protein [Ardenticatena sp.]